MGTDRSHSRQPYQGTVGSLRTCTTSRNIDDVCDFFLRVRTEHDGLRQSCASVGLCVMAHDAGLDTSEVNVVVKIGGWAGATKFPACHL
jgi:hypothetical protein